MTSARPKLTDDERAARRRADRDRLEQAARTLLSSDGWQNWIRVRATNGLRRYSLHNQLLIALARPDATFVAGFRAWRELGYCVRRGERAIRILAPMPIKDRDRTSGEETGETVTLFKAVSVFDRRQVDLDSVEPLDLKPPCVPLTGDSHAHLLAPLERFAGTLGFTVAFERLDGPAGGWCDTDAKRIVVDDGAPDNAQVRTLIHEVAHALGVGYAEYGRERAEVIVDTVTFVAASSVGLDVAGEAVPYVAGWGEDGALEAVTEFAKTIDELARRIETALETNDAEDVAETRAAA